MQSSTLCWRCVNSVPGLRKGCSWSRSFIPVEGWTANSRPILYDGHIKQSYAVILCPEFVEEPKRKECYEFGAY